MPVVASENSILLENLRTAFACESNTHARYVKFAEEADGECWNAVGCLFKAAAYAEQIHAGNHGRILRQLGGEAEFVREPVEVKATVENLRTALAGELFEVETMYPAFVEQARPCRDAAVLRTFTWALAAEKTHVRLFSEALAGVECEGGESWVTMIRAFYVCAVCGYTSEHEHESEMCPECNCAWRGFVMVR